MEPMVRYIVWSKDEVPDYFDLDASFFSKEKAQEIINFGEDGDPNDEYCIIKVTLEWQ